MRRLWGVPPRFGVIACVALVAAAGGQLSSTTAAAGALAAPPSVVTIGDAAIREGHSHTRTISVPVTLDVAAGSAQTVSYTVAGGTATAGPSSAAAPRPHGNPATGTQSFSATTGV